MIGERCADCHRTLFRSRGALRCLRCGGFAEKHPVLAWYLRVRSLYLAVIAERKASK